MFYINLDIETDVRYEQSKFVDLSGGFPDFITSFFMEQLLSLPLAGTRIVQNEAGKPDLLSYNIFKSCQYWWILMMYNNLIFVNELVEGLTIKYPAKSQMESIYFQLLAYETGRS